MSRRSGIAALLAAMVLGSLLTTGASATETALPFPDTMAAVGDSITQAASSAGSLGADAPQNSWATGTSSSVNSHYLRLLALGAPISGANHNLSVSGAKMAGLDAQMLNAVGLQPDYVTVLIGGNDVCTDTVGEMTSVATFRAQFEVAMSTLTSDSPDTHVYVVSIPDVYQLWSLFHGSFWARFVWSVGDVCQSLLANPTSTQQVDVQRRLEVRQRNIDFNTQLAQVCALYASRCHFDGNAVFNTPFTTSDVSGDYFHPSIAGQAKLASVSWAAGYAWSASPPPPDTPIWVGDMSSAASSGGRNWTATVTIAVTDGTNPVSDVVVTGTWSAGSGATTCTTGEDGTCPVRSSNLNKKTTSVTFTVSSLAAPGFVYMSTSNVMTSLLVSKP
jgi:lysophospholipase L1-like esterase